MQLTKDDVKTAEQIEVLSSHYLLIKDTGFISISKFQQVVAFYEKYKDEPMKFMKEVDVCFYDDVQGYAIFKEMYASGKFNDWLFNYCFKQGLQ